MLVARFTKNRVFSDGNQIESRNTQEAFTYRLKNYSNLQ